MLVALFAFVGQTFAAPAMPCEMAMNHQDHTQMMAMHSDSMMETMSSLEQDCCNDECGCVTNACAPVMLAVNSNALSYSLGSVEKILITNAIELKNYATSLYRPPILI